MLIHLLLIYVLPILPSFHHIVVVVSVIFIDIAHAYEFFIFLRPLPLLLKVAHLPSAIVLPEPVHKLPRVVHRLPLVVRVGYVGLQFLLHLVVLLLALL